jgi:hypothetical protein
MSLLRPNTGIKSQQQPSRSIEEMIETRGFAKETVMAETLIGVCSTEPSQNLLKMELVPRVSGRPLSVNPTVGFRDSPARPRRSLVDEHGPFL